MLDQQEGEEADLGEREANWGEEKLKAGNGYAYGKRWSSQKGRPVAQYAHTTPDHPRCRSQHQQAWPCMPFVLIGALNVPPRWSEPPQCWRRGANRSRRLLNEGPEHLSGMRGYREFGRACRPHSLQRLPKRLAWEWLLQPTEFNEGNKEKD